VLTSLPAGSLRAANVAVTRSAVSVQRVLVDRFPYAVIYFEADDVIYVIAIAHTKRRPLYWQARLRRVPGLAVKE